MKNIFDESKDLSMTSAQKLLARIPPKSLVVHLEVKQALVHSVSHIWHLILKQR